MSEKENDYAEDIVEKILGDTDDKEDKTSCKCKKLKHKLFHNKHQKLNMRW